MRAFVSGVSFSRVCVCVCVVCGVTAGQSAALCVTSLQSWAIACSCVCLFIVAILLAAVGRPLRFLLIYFLLPLARGVALTVVRCVCVCVSRCGGGGGGDNTPS